MKLKREYRWGLTAFAVHTLFLGAVLVVERLSGTFTLRNLHEFVIDRHAFEMWWWVQHRFPRELGVILYPFAKRWGLELVSNAYYVLWYVTVGAMPYVLGASVAGRLHASRQHRAAA